MLFNSPEFLIYFLPVTLIGFVVLGRFGRRSAIGWLALMSLVFYGYWKISFLWLLAGSILGNFLISRLIAADVDRPKRQHFWLVFGIVANLALLVRYKYLFAAAHFFVERGAFHHDLRHVALPLGISFFTFTQLGYLVDLKQGQAEKQSLLSYTLFVTFFPHLIAGPILHHKEIMPQFAEERRYGLDLTDFTMGWNWFIIGFFKKVMIADNIRIYADGAFTNPHAPISMGSAWIATLVYMLQLYFDFSGYSEMAVGLARMFSIRFPFNFNSPYKADSVREFWQRWHMTLTRYILEYLYAPMLMWVSRTRQDKGLSVNRRAQGTWGGMLQMVAFPTIATMFLAGVWHGAGLQFIIFGMLHGVVMTIEHAWNLHHKKTGPKSKLVHALSVLRVNLTALVAFVFFRSESISDAMTLLKRMVGIGASHADKVNLHAVAVVLVLFPFVWFMPNTQQVLGDTETGPDPRPAPLGLRWRPNAAWGLGMGTALFLCLLYMSRGTVFLYFQF